MTEYQPGDNLRWQQEHAGTLITEEPAKPWRAEVTTSDTGYVDKWNTNSLRFETKEAALEYAANLARRWMLVTRWRAVDESVPLDQPYEEGSEEGRW
jgi:hypothetical protein